ncbi:class I SAM-dependent methyltransferase [bacterium]|nr:class I SAM-dependent methyltransferase [bacterium]
MRHGEYLVKHDPGNIWNWESPAGKVRWNRRVRMLISHITAEMNVLEIGCGTGCLTLELERTGAAITAVDISRDLLERARLRITSPRVTFLEEDCCHSRFPDDTFDTIIGSSVLHHLDIDAALHEIYRLLKPGGSIFFTEPNMLNPQIALQKNIPYLKRKLGDSPDETAFIRWSLKNKMLKEGFSAIKIVPFDFLHPGIPRSLISIVQPLCSWAEKIPMVSEIAGSLYIRAVKAGDE